MNNNNNFLKFLSKSEWKNLKIFLTQNSMKIHIIWNNFQNLQFNLCML